MVLARHAEVMRAVGYSVPDLDETYRDPAQVRDRNGLGSNVAGKASPVMPDVNDSTQESTSMNQAVENSYDQVPYESFPFRQSHPDRLATIATLMGLNTAPLAKARVLELGCSSGGNLLPLSRRVSRSAFRRRRCVEQGD